MNIVCTRCGRQKYSSIAGCTCPDPREERIKELESLLSKTREGLKDILRYEDERYRLGFGRGPTVYTITKQLLAKLEGK